jgi:hypothetical protein
MRYFANNCGFRIRWIDLLNTHKSYLQLNITLLLIVPLEITPHQSIQSISNSLHYPFRGKEFVAQEL